MESVSSNSSFREDRDKSISEGRPDCDASESGSISISDGESVGSSMDGWADGWSDSEGWMDRMISLMISSSSSDFDSVALNAVDEMGALVCVEYDAESAEEEADAMDAMVEAVGTASAVTVPTTAEIVSTASLTNPLPLSRPRSSISNISLSPPKLGMNLVHQNVNRMARSRMRCLSINATTRKKNAREEKMRSRSIQSARSRAFTSDLEVVRTFVRVLCCDEAAANVAVDDSIQCDKEVSAVSMRKMEGLTEHLG